MKLGKGRIEARHRMRRKVAGALLVVSVSIFWTLLFTPIICSLLLISTIRRNIDRVKVSEVRVDEERLQIQLECPALYYPFEVTTKALEIGFSNSRNERPFSYLQTEEILGRQRQEKGPPHNNNRSRSTGFHLRSTFFYRLGKSTAVEQPFQMKVNDHILLTIKGNISFKLLSWVPSMWFPVILFSMPGIHLGAPTQPPETLVERVKELRTGGPLNKKPSLSNTAGKKEKEEPRISILRYSVTEDENVLYLEGVLTYSHKLPNITVSVPGISAAVVANSEKVFRVEVSPHEIHLGRLKRTISFRASSTLQQINALRKALMRHERGSLTVLRVENINVITSKDRPIQAPSPQPPSYTPKEAFIETFLQGLFSVCKCQMKRKGVPGEGQRRSLGRDGKGQSLLNIHFWKAAQEGLKATILIRPGMLSISGDSKIAVTINSGQLPQLNVLASINGVPVGELLMSHIIQQKNQLSSTAEDPQAQQHLHIEAVGKFLSKSISLSEIVNGPERPNMAQALRSCTLEVLDKGHLLGRLLQGAGLRWKKSKGFQVGYYYSRKQKISMKVKHTGTYSAKVSLRQNTAEQGSSPPLSRVGQDKLSSFIQPLLEVSFSFGARTEIANWVDITWDTSCFVLVKGSTTMNLLLEAGGLEVLLGESNSEWSMRGVSPIRTTLSVSPEKVSQGSSRPAESLSLTAVAVGGVSPLSNITYVLSNSIKIDGIRRNKVESKEAAPGNEWHPVNDLVRALLQQSSFQLESTASTNSARAYIKGCTTLKPNTPSNTPANTSTNTNTNPLEELGRTLLSNPSTASFLVLSVEVPAVSLSLLGESGADEEVAQIESTQGLVKLVWATHGGHSLCVTGAPLPNTEEIPDHLSTTAEKSSPGILLCATVRNKLVRPKRVLLRQPCCTTSQMASWKALMSVLTGAPSVERPLTSTPQEIKEYTPQVCVRGRIDGRSTSRQMGDISISGYISYEDRVKRNTTGQGPYLVPPVLPNSVTIGTLCYQLSHLSHLSHLGGTTTATSNSRHILQLRAHLMFSVRGPLSAAVTVQGSINEEAIKRITAPLVHTLWISLAHTPDGAPGNAFTLTQDALSEIVSSFRAAMPKKTLSYSDLSVLPNWVPHVTLGPADSYVCPSTSLVRVVLPIYVKELLNGSISSLAAKLAGTNKRALSLSVEAFSVPLFNLTNTAGLICGAQIEQGVYSFKWPGGSKHKEEAELGASSTASLRLSVCAPRNTKLTSSEILKAQINPEALILAVKDLSNTVEVSKESSRDVAEKEVSMTYLEQLQSSKRVTMNTQLEDKSLAQKMFQGLVKSLYWVTPEKYIPAPVKSLIGLKKYFALLNYQIKKDPETVSNLGKTQNSSVSNSIVLYVEAPKCLSVSGKTTLVLVLEHHHEGILLVLPLSPSKKEGVCFMLLGAYINKPIIKRLWRAQDKSQIKAHLVVSTKRVLSVEIDSCLIWRSLGQVLPSAYKEGLSGALLKGVLPRISTLLEYFIVSATGEVHDEADKQPMEVSLIREMLKEIKKAEAHGRVYAIY